jgi:ketosteroid isomerase-like protein
MSRIQVNPLATSDEDQILALNRKWGDAEVRHDDAVLQRILDDRFVCTWPSGMTVDKAGFITAVFHGSFISQTFSDEITLIHGDTAVSVGTDTVKGFATYGAEETDVLRFTATYIKRDGQWRAVAEHISELASGA